MSIFFAKNIVLFLEMYFFESRTYLWGLHVYLNPYLGHSMCSKERSVWSWHIAWDMHRQFWKNVPTWINSGVPEDVLWTILCVWPCVEEEIWWLLEIFFFCLLACFVLRCECAEVGFLGTTHGRCGEDGFPWNCHGWTQATCKPHRHWWNQRSPVGCRPTHQDSPDPREIPNLQTRAVICGLWWVVP